MGETKRERGMGTRELGNYRNREGEGNGWGMGWELGNENGGMGWEQNGNGELRNYRN
jgi:hypothetical protein